MAASLVYWLFVTQAKTHFVQHYSVRRWKIVSLHLERISGVYVIALYKSTFLLTYLLKKYVTLNDLERRNDQIAMCIGLLWLWLLSVLVKRTTVR